MAEQATITTFAEFPKTTMLENLTVRADGSVLVVASPQRQVWFAPASSDGQPVEPVLLHTFDEGQLAQSVVEAEPDVFYVFTYGVATMHRLDLRGWTPGEPVSPTKVLDLDSPAGPNGADLLAPGVMLLADCVQGLIWRIDLSEDGLSATAKVWLQHESMEAGGGHPDIQFNEHQTVPFPGINGLRYGPRTQHAYWATSSLNVVMRVAVDQTTFEPSGEPEHLGDVDNVDDLALDEDAGFLYVTRHPDHQIERVPLEPGAPGQAIVAGDPFTDHLIGPTSLHWGRAPGDYGRVAYAPTDGGVIKLPPDGELRPARLVRVELPVEHAAQG